MIVREPVQTLDSQFTLHSNNFLKEGVENKKVSFITTANEYLGQSKRQSKI